MPPYVKVDMIDETACAIGHQAHGLVAQHVFQIQEGV
jgi:hypothetical protein